MEETSRYVMRCPKCMKRFPLTEHYCESCSAMLDPVEIEGGAEKDQRELAAGSVACVGSEDFEDMKIDYLRADIENRFVYTLLLERDKLNRRLSEKEKSLEELQCRTSDMDEDSLLAAARKEKDISLIVKRVARVESTLDEMEKTLGADIDDLKMRLDKLQQPGLLWFLRARGRYYRMLASQMTMKERLVKMLRKKMPPHYFGVRRPGMASFLIVLSVIITVAVSWQVFTYRYKPRMITPVTQTVSKGSAVGKEMIKEEDIINLLEDIRKANLNKDLNLWESRYSKQYLGLPGKKASVAEQWKNFDYQSLEFEVDGVTTGPDTANAHVTWRMELSSRKSKTKEALSQSVSAVFRVEDGKLKIRSVTKQ